MISDFIDEGFEKILKVVGGRHDLIGVVLKDAREEEIPKIGLMKFTDSETGEERWIDTSNNISQFLLKEIHERKNAKRKSLFLSSKLDSIEIQTGQNLIKPLVQFFKIREKRW